MPSSFHWGCPQTRTAWPLPFVVQPPSLQAGIQSNKLKCCDFTGKQASKIESTSLCCRSYSVLHHVIDQENEWSVFVE